MSKGIEGTGMSKNCDSLIEVGFCGAAPVGEREGELGYFAIRGVQRLLHHCERAIQTGKLDTRSEIADAVLDLRADFPEDRKLPDVDWVKEVAALASKPSPALSNEEFPVLITPEDRSLAERWYDHSQFKPMPEYRESFVYLKSMYESRTRELRKAQSSIASLANKQNGICVDCRDHENNLKVWIERLGGDSTSKHLSLTLESLLDSKPSPAPEGIKRYSMVSILPLGLDVYEETLVLASDHQALLSAKDAELINLLRELEDARALIVNGDGSCDHCGRVPSIVMPTSLCDECVDGLKRAETAEAELTSLRASSARIEEETLRKAAAAICDYCKYRPERPVENRDGIYYHPEMHAREDGSEFDNSPTCRAQAIFALLPTSPEKEQTGEEG